jgi:hypothetical protein
MALSVRKNLSRNLYEGSWVLTAVVMEGMIWVQSKIDSLEYISEEHIASIFSVEEKVEQELCLSWAFNLTIS